MSLALANDRQPNNFTLVTPKGHDMQIVLLDEIIRDFRRPGTFRTKLKQFRRELTTFDKSKMVGQTIIAVSSTAIGREIASVIVGPLPKDMCTPNNATSRISSLHSVQFFLYYDQQMHSYLYLYLYLYPFSVHVVTFNFITNLMHLFNS